MSISEAVFGDRRAPTEIKSISGEVILSLYAEQGVLAEKKIARWLGAVEDTVTMAGDNKVLQGSAMLVGSA